MQRAASLHAVALDFLAGDAQSHASPLPVNAAPNPIPETTREDIPFDDDRPSESMFEQVKADLFSSSTLSLTSSAFHALGSWKAPEFDI
jgi:hypothetical protein